MFLKHNSPNEASKLFLHHPSDAGWMLEGQEGGRDFRNVCLHAAPCSSRAAQNLTFAAVKAFWGQTLISGKCGYKIDKSREEAPLLLLALMMLVPLDSPFSILQPSNLPIPPDQRFFSISPGFQVPSAQTCSPRTWAALCWKGPWTSSSTPHPLPQNPQLIPWSTFSSWQKMWIFVCKALQPPCSIFIYFFPGGHWDSWKPLLETTPTSSYFPSLRHAKLDKAERTWEHFCLREETGDPAEEHPESSFIE